MLFLELVTAREQFLIDPVRESLFHLRFVEFMIF